MLRRSKKMGTPTLSRAHRASLITIALFAVIYLCNNFFTSFNLQQFKWQPTNLMPVGLPITGDFHHNYVRSRKLVESGDYHFYRTANYHPPLIHLLYLPLALFSYPVAAKLYLLLSILALALTFYLCFCWLIKTYDPPPATTTLLCTSLMLFYLLSSYALALSLGRGNNESFSLLLSFAACYLLMHHPKAFWWPIILIAVAVNIKVYPAIFYIMLLWRFGWRCLPHIILVNLAFLFISGPENAIGFIQWLSKSGMSSEYNWLGNHSAVGFVTNVLAPLGYRGKATVYSCMALPLIPWLYGLYRLRQHSMSDQLWFSYALSLPVALIIPAISHDYKLIILTPALLWLCQTYLARLSLNHDTRTLAKAAILWLILLLMHRCPIYLHSPAVAGSKYLYVICLQLLILLELVDTPPKLRSRA